MSQRFSDSFDRQQLGPAWHTTRSSWRIDNGQLCVRGARNHGAWLKRRLPVNARIEFDAVSDSPDGDIKIEVWGDGRSHATSVSYRNATSYLVIFGGWKNRMHVLARLDEHGKDRLAHDIDRGSDDPARQPVLQGRSYRFKIERSDGRTLRWYVDGELMHQLNDREPLKGEGHEYFGFNDWDVPVCFDNLVITPLGD